MDGELRQRRNRRSQTIDVTYDALHRPLTRVGTASVSWSYGNHGRVVTATSAPSVETIYASVFGAPDSVKTVMAGQTFWRRYQYNAAGVVTTTTPTATGGATFSTRTYSYNTARGLATGITLAANTTTLTPDNNGNVVSRIFPGSGGTVNFTMSTLNSPLKSSSAAAYNPDILRYAGLDGAGRLDRQLETPTTSRKYTFDALGRLSVTEYQTAAAGPPAGCPDPVTGMDSPFCQSGQSWTTQTTTNYSYDLAGNRTDLGGTYTTGNRLTAFNGCTYTSDAENNVTQRVCGTTTTTFVWAAEGTLDSVNVAVSGVTTRAMRFRYDALGRLVQRRQGTVQSNFVWDGEDLLAELTGAATSVVAEHSYYGMDVPHALLAGGATYYSQQDLLGNVVAVTTTSGTTARTYQYGDWGAAAGTGGPIVPPGDRVRWKGALSFAEETELYYLRARWYDPGTGRFLSEDPIGLGGGINPSVFAGDEPVNGRDPTGECTWVWIWTPLAPMRICMPDANGQRIAGVTILVTPIDSRMSVIHDHGAVMNFLEGTMDRFLPLLQMGGTSLGSYQTSRVANAVARMKGLGGLCATLGAKAQALLGAGKIRFISGARRLGGITMPIPDNVYLTNLAFSLRLVQQILAHETYHFLFPDSRWPGNDNDNGDPVYQAGFACGQ